ncbi:uncharacterized protein troap isoform 2-T3 [Odontesthes bonariensis]|uniref:uncharacterized protein troap isoform X2 n=1 Tax=Odontesthes bonariensis TaxID=219752 RepID=UPI003F5844C2
MDSSPVLRQQNRNKICSDFQRMKNEQNKKRADPKFSSSHLSKKDCENKDPAVSCLKPPFQQAVSRLPVLAKSLRLQTPSDFGQSHLRWEEKPLAGKTRKKKPCTRPVPFNLSQPKNRKEATENHQPLTAPQLRTHSIQPEKNTRGSKPTKRRDGSNSNGDSAKGVGKSHGKNTQKASHLSAQPALSNTLKTSATLSNPPSSVPGHTSHQKDAPSCAQQPPGAEVCLDNMNLLSLKDSHSTLNADQTAQPTTQGNPSKASNGENFQADHAALLSILRNEGVGVAGRVSATPHSKPYNYLPQRVSVLKSRQMAGPAPALVRSAQFSSDPAALQSILLNEGVKDGRPTGATPRNSVCPPGRGISIYTAQRVPVRKERAEPAGGPVAALKETPLKKWTPQRVRNTKHQPMSAVKWHQSTQQSPYSTPVYSTSRSVKCRIQPRQEEVVQRLFDDPEDEQSTNVMEKAPVAHAEQFPLQPSSNKPPCEEVETSSTTSDHEEEEQKTLQAPPRESVIFFSTGKKLLRAPRFKLESTAQQDQQGPVSSEQRKVPTGHDERSAESELIGQINPSVQRLYTDLIVQKSCSLNPVMAMLRKRLPPLEDLRMDEEVATYTSVSVPAAPGFVLPRPRCGNPLASILHFEESTRFVPIDPDLSSGPSSLHER